MISPLTVGLGTPELLLFRMAFAAGFAVLAAIIFLSFRIDADYNDGIYWVLGSIAGLLFLFAAGGENFSVPIPGLIWGIAAIYLTFGFGILVGWLLPYDADVAMRRDSY
ncbi:hypothetical protein [Halocatena halophila]|uniref:hypothetical protein n=1 Tax=Halocatena halophila TaxID=2814576 RepID=UPI002ED1C0E5